MDDYWEDTPHEKIGVPDSKGHRTLSVLTEVCNADRGVLIARAAVTYVWDMKSLWLSVSLWALPVHNDKDYMTTDRGQFVIP